MDVDVIFVYQHWQ